MFHIAYVNHIMIHVSYVNHIMIHVSYVNHISSYAKHISFVDHNPSMHELYNIHKSHNKNVEMCN